MQVGLFGDDFGRHHGLEVVLLERLVGVFLDEFLNYLAADLLAEESLEQIARGMAGAEALEHNAAFEFVECAIQLMLDFVGLDFNRKFAPETVGFFDIYIHGGSTFTDKHTAVVGINRRPETTHPCCNILDAAGKRFCDCLRRIRNSRAPSTAHSIQRSPSSAVGEEICRLRG